MPAKPEDKKIGEYSLGKNKVTTKDKLLFAIIAGIFAYLFIEYTPKNPIVLKI
jgi:hypothetical protein